MHPALLRIWTLLATYICHADNRFTILYILKGLIKYDLTTKQIPDKNCVFELEEKI